MRPITLFSLVQDEAKNGKKKEKKKKNEEKRTKEKKRKRKRTQGGKKEKRPQRGACPPRRLNFFFKRFEIEASQKSDFEHPKKEKEKKRKKDKKKRKMLRYAPFSDPIPCPVLFLSQFLLSVIVVQLVSGVLVFSCSQPVRCF